jgi:hypothetical protein
MISLPDMLWGCFGSLGMLWGCFGSLDILGYKEIECRQAPKIGYCLTVCWTRTALEGGGWVSGQNVRRKIRSWIDNRHMIIWWVLPVLRDRFEN